MVNKPKTQESHEPEALVIHGVGSRRELLVCYTCNCTKGENEEGNNYCNMCDHYFQQTNYYQRLQITLVALGLENNLINKPKNERTRYN